MKASLFTVLYFCAWGAALRILVEVLPAAVTCTFVSISCVMFGAIVAYFFYPDIKRMYYDARVSSHNKAVFITGCDSGFGHELAKRLDSKGFHVFAGCLDPAGEGAQTLKEVCSSRLHVVSLDVTKDESVKEAATYVKNNLGSSEIWAVVNNAGIYKGCDVAMTKIQDFKDVLSVNTLGPVRVTKAFLPDLVNSRGRVVTVTSILSEIAFPHSGAYNMSKYAARAFCETLRQEIQPWGVKVIEIEPEAFRTNIVSNCLAAYEDCVKPLDEETKSYYGEIYFNEFRKGLVNSRNLCSTRIYEVVDSLEDAVSLQEPRRVYKVTRNMFLKFLIFLMGYTPCPVLEIVFSAFKWTTGFPTPREAENPF